MLHDATTICNQLFDAETVLQTLYLLSGNTWLWAVQLPVYTGVLALSKLGVCEAPRTLLDTKDKLAALDEVMVQQQAAHGIPSRSPV